MRSPKANSKVAGRVCKTLPYTVRGIRNCSAGRTRSGRTCGEWAASRKIDERSVYIVGEPCASCTRLQAETTPESEKVIREVVEEPAGRPISWRKRRTNSALGIKEVKG